jgi:hypothetical protein
MSIATTQLSPVTILLSDSGILSYSQDIPIFPSNPKAGNEHFVTTTGNSAGAVIESYIYDGTVWAKRPYSNVRFGSAIPTVLPTDNENDTYIRTSDGTPTGTIISTYVFDKTTNVWYPQSSLVVLDGNNVNVNRANAIQGVAPTALEAANPIDGDTVTLNLNNGLKEQWSFVSGAWVLIVTETSIKKLRFLQALTAGNNVINYGTTISSAPVMVDVLNNTTGAVITHRVVTETTTSVTINVTGAITSARITIIG